MNIEEVIQWLEEYILEEYGECCEDFIINCVVCQKYLALQILHDELHYNTEGVKTN